MKLIVLAVFWALVGVLLAYCVGVLQWLLAGVDIYLAVTV